MKIFGFRNPKPRHRFKTLGLILTFALGLLAWNQDLSPEILDDKVQDSTPKFSLSQEEPKFFLADIDSCRPPAKESHCAKLQLLSGSREEEEVLRYFDLVEEKSENTQNGGFGLNSSFCDYDEKTRLEAKNTTLELTRQQAEIKRLEREAVTPEGQAALKRAQAQAQKTARNLAEPMSKAIFSPGKIGAVAGGAAMVAGLGLGIADAVGIKNNGGSDAEAAASILSGMGIAGAIPAVLACEGCTPNEKAAAFFSGFFGVDLTTLVVCPGRNCPGDRDLAEYQDNDKNDWSYKRIKKSCPIGHPVVGTIHAQWNLDIVCGGPVTAPPLHTYYYRDNGHNESRMNYSLDCEKGDYVAGISFGVMGNVYGIKSILCGVPKGGRLKGQCDYKAWRQGCPAHQYVGGIHLQRQCRQSEYMGVFVNIIGRLDDSAEYGDNIYGLTCCNY